MWMPTIQIENYSQRRDEIFFSVAGWISSSQCNDFSERRRADDADMLNENGMSQVFWGVKIARNVIAGEMKRMPALIDWKFHWENSTDFPRALFGVVVGFTLSCLHLRLFLFSFRNFSSSQLNCWICPCPILRAEFRSRLNFNFKWTLSEMRKNDMIFYFN